MQNNLIFLRDSSTFRLAAQQLLWNLHVKHGARTGSSTCAAMGDRAAAAPVSDAPTQQQVSTSDRTGSTGRTASTACGAKVLHSSPAVARADSCCVRSARDGHDGICTRFVPLLLRITTMT